MSDSDSKNVTKTLERDRAQPAEKVIKLQGNQDVGWSEMSPSRAVHLHPNAQFTDSRHSVDMKSALKKERQRKYRELHRKELKEREAERRKRRQQPVNFAEVERIFTTKTSQKHKGTYIDIMSNQLWTGYQKLILEKFQGSSKVSTKTRLQTEDGTHPPCQADHSYTSKVSHENVFKVKVAKKHVADAGTSLASSAPASYWRQQNHLEELPAAETDDTDLTAEELNKQALQVTVARIEGNPQLYIGIPKNCYHLVELLHKRTRIPTVHILLCLKKVKLDTQFEELADQFGIIKSQATQIFVTNIPLIADALQSFITNLENTVDAVQCNIPILFRAKQQNAACIIDFLELKIQPTKYLNENRDERLNASIHIDVMQTEKGNTVKYLISTSPDGFITHASPGYGGRISDEQLLQNTKYVERLKPGSCIIAKKVFQNTKPILSKRGLHMIKAGVTQGPIPGPMLLNNVKPVLDLECHVERIVHRLKEFSMVNEHTVINADLVGVLDDAVVISCALINLQNLLLN